MVENIFIQLSLIVVIALVVSIIARALRQPLIVGYIVAGIILGSSFFHLTVSTENINVFAQLGIATLLFMVGLHLNPKVIRDVGGVALITGIGQIVFTLIIGFLIGRLMGFGSVTSFYIALALSFSSTIIITKLLSDKGDLSSLYGKISVGFLIVQDLIAIIALMIISSMNGGIESNFSIQKVGIGIGLLVALFLISFFILPFVTKIIAKSQELLLLFSLGWALALASLFSYLGFSIEIGALLAGMSLAISPYKYEIGAKMKPLRDFFLLMFFIVLGSQLSFGGIKELLFPTIIFVTLVLVANPLIMMVLMGFMGYTKRTSFLAGLTVSQISEFSFILIALGISAGHIPQNILSMITVVGLITMATSSYALTNSNYLYNLFSPYISIFERKGRKIDEAKYHTDEKYDVILFGYNRVGYSFLKSFALLNKKVLVVDNNPKIIEQLVKKKIACRYGDAEDLEMLDELPLKNASMIISTIPEYDTNLIILRKIKRINSDIIFMAVSHQIDEALRLYDAGASYVITPHFFGGAYVAQLIEKYGFDRNKFIQDGVKEKSDLIKRKKEGQKDVLHERD